MKKRIFFLGIFILQMYLSKAQNFSVMSYPLLVTAYVRYEHDTLFYDLELLNFSNDKVIWTNCNKSLICYFNTIDNYFYLHIPIGSIDPISPPRSSFVLNNYILPKDSFMVHKFIDCKANKIPLDSISKVNFRADFITSKNKKNIINKFKKREWWHKYFRKSKVFKVSFQFSLDN